jgi:hypothetical protein
VIAMNKKSHTIPAATLASVIAFTLANLFWLPAQAVPLLTATAGVVAGQTNGKVGCTTYGPSDQLNGFTFKTGGVPIGGIEACGYAGSFITSTGSSGTVIQSNSPPGILLGTNPQLVGTYTGNATARASFGNLGVKTDGSIVGPSVTGSTVLFQATAGAIFTDKLTATSSLVANGTAGTVRYLLGFSGSETVPQRLVSGGFGEAYAEVELTHGTEQVLRFLAYRKD